MKKQFLLALILVSSAFAAFANGSDENDGAPASAKDGKMGGVLVFARSGDSVGLDPARETDGESFYASHQIFDTLVEFKTGTTEIVPALADKWEVSKDGLNYKFFLRKGVKFHDGTPFNAEAVVFSFMRQLDENHPYYEYGPWKYWGYMDMSAIVDTITAVNEYTVEFKLKKVEAPFIANLAMDFAAIVSPTAYKANPEGFASKPVGTGPFKFVSWTKDSDIVLEKNKDYWQPVYLDRLILKVIPDATARWLALQKGEADIIDFPAADDLPAMDKDDNIQLIQQPGLNVGYLALNNEKKPYDDKRVRQAMNYAINRDEIIKAVYGSAGQPAKNPIPPTMWSYNDDIKPYPYDPAKAKALLAEAGYPNGFETEIWAMPVARPYNPDARKIAEIMQAQLAKVNIKVEIISYEWGTYLDKTDTGEHQAAMLGWTGDNGDPDNFLFVLLSIPAAEKPAGNIAFWRNEAFNSLIVEAKETTDAAKRTQLYRKAQEIFHEEAPWVTIAHSVVTVPARTAVKNFKISPTGLRVFKQVWIEK
ncbi:MAG: ABC transporter substrate-binding protein [Spirochaeta sp. LUC14_002_19_P3]|nr:MAG: ABC transporter substrate-binding protein [Spirochaeta sp. LUC14_002_19_P3]